ncbi:hypothetical protein GCM10027348_16310 [Hymenobacter tenuis]
MVWFVHWLTDIFDQGATYEYPLLPALLPLPGAYSRCAATPSSYLNRHTYVQPTPQ